MGKGWSRVGLGRLSSQAKEGIGLGRGAEGVRQQVVSTQVERSSVTGCAKKCNRWHPVRQLVLLSQTVGRVRRQVESEGRSSQTVGRVGRQVESDGRSSRTAGRVGRQVESDGRSSWTAGRVGRQVELDGRSSRTQHHQCISVTKVIARRNSENDLGQEVRRCHL